MKRKVLQKIADSILNKLDQSTDSETAQFYYDLGIWFNDISIHYFQVYLD